MRRTECRRLSAESGFWKTICRRRELPRVRFWNRGASAVPSRTTEPVVGSTRPSSARASVVLPTRTRRPGPSVSPGQTRAVTSTRAWISLPCWLEGLPELVELDQRGRRAVDDGELEVEPARGNVCARSWYQQRAVAVAEQARAPARRWAALVGERTAVDEDAAGQLAPSCGRKPGIVSSRPWSFADAAARDAAEQADGVRVPRVLEHGLDGPLLDEPARVEDADAVTHLRDRAEVVADEEHRGIELRLELGDEVEDLGLDRRVEAGRRLVEDQERGILGERHRDHDPLLHAARELMRVAPHHGAHVRDLHLARAAWARSRPRASP